MTRDLVCPVCGYEPLADAAWVGDSASDEICPSCGTQFGYDDFADDPATRHLRHLELRRAWVSGGHPWSSPSRPQPADWDPQHQLGRVAGTT